MKIPGVGEDESVLVIGVALLAAYAAYRAYSTGSQIASNVSTTLNNAAGKVANAYNTVADGLNVATGAAGARARALTNGGNAPQDAANQSAAETARLSAQNQTVTDSIPTTTTPTYDALGNFQGNTEVPDTPTVSTGVDSSTTSVAQLYSPDALGSVDFGNAPSTGGSW